MRGVVAALLLVGALVAGCYTGPAPSHYVTVLDELHVPAGWRVLATKIHGPDADAAIHCSPITDGECPSVLRYYAVSGDPNAVLTSGKDMLAAAGFQLDRELGSTCAPVSGSSYCAFESARAHDHVLLAIYGSADQAGIPEVQAPGLVVVLTAKA